VASIYKPSYQTKCPKTGKSIRRRYRHWYIKYKAADGKRRVVRGLKDKQLTQQMAADLERAVERELAGLADPFEKHRKAELTKHLADYRRHLEAKGDGPNHVKETVGRIDRLLCECEFGHWADISGSRAAAWLAEQREKNIAGDVDEATNRAAGFGKRTSNYYLTALKGFCRWLVRDGRAPHNPLDYLEAMNADDDIRRERRALSEKEFHALIKATRGRTDRRKIGGDSRAILYMVAAYTGLRAGELASLTASSFDLDAQRVTVLAGYSKRRRQDEQPLRADLVELLREFLSGRTADTRLWPGRWFRRAAEMLVDDLTAAGIDYRDARGRVLDFHALRHTYITSLHRGGTYGKILQEMARHSTPTLTARYTHVEMRDLEAALDGLPKLPTSNAPARTDAAPKKGRRHA